MKFIDYGGIPAIGTLLAGTVGVTIGKGEWSEITRYNGYYATVGLALTSCVGALAAAMYANGCRGREFAKIYDTVKTAFFLSSSSGPGS